MRRHPSWPGTPAAAAAAATGMPSVLASPTSPRLPPAQDTTPGHRTSTPAADSTPAAGEDGDSDSDGAAGVSDDAQDDMQHDEVLPATARVPRGSRPRKYIAQELAVMRELKLSYLANITRKTLSTGAMRWSVKLCAEGLATKSRELCGESLRILSGRDLWALICRMVSLRGCWMRHCFSQVGCATSAPSHIPQSTYCDMLCVLISPCCSK
jgi:hypothetical protein